MASIATICNDNSGLQSDHFPTIQRIGCNADEMTGWGDDLDRPFPGFGLKIGIVIGNALASEEFCAAETVHLELCKGQPDLLKVNEVGSVQLILSPVQLFKAESSGEVEGPDSETFQVVQVGTAPDLLTQLVGDRPEIGAGPAVDIEMAEVIVHAIKLKGVNGDFLEKLGNRLAGSSQFIEAFSFVPFGGERRRSLKKGTHIFRCEVIQLLQLRPELDRVGCDISLTIIGGRGVAKTNQTLVGLIHPGQKLLKLGRTAQAEHHEPFCLRIESSRMAHPFETKDLPGSVHNIVGCSSRSFVYE